ncbi:MAG: hypothetical protein ACYCSH_02030 [Acidithiobacillus sp.]
MIVKNQRYLIANPVSWPGHFWIFTGDGGFYHSDRMRRISHRIRRGQQALI